MSKPRRFYREVDGILLFDKPLGLSSNAALQQVRLLFGARKAGHAGSLDPLASGLLPICFGQATKVCGRLLDASKTYRVDVQLGARTESLDLETAVVERAAVPPLDPAKVGVVLAGFAGEQQQVPPMHSALKHQGQRLYELARRGETVERAARRITIHKIGLVGLQGDRLQFEVRCSKGTYIRSLAADIAQRLGTLGYLAGLRRLSIDPFDGHDMHTLAELQGPRTSDSGQAPDSGQAAAPSSPGDLQRLDALLLGADAAFGELAAVQLDAAAERSLLQGQTAATRSQTPPGTLRAYGAGGRFLGLVMTVVAGRVRPVRLFVGAADQ